MYFGHTRLPRVPEHRAPLPESGICEHVFLIWTPFCLSCPDGYFLHPLEVSEVRLSSPILRAGQVVPPHVSSSWHKDQESTKFPPHLPCRQEWHLYSYIPFTEPSTGFLNIYTTDEPQIWSYGKPQCLCISALIRGTFHGANRMGWWRRWIMARLHIMGVEAFIGAWRTYCPGHMYTLPSDVGKLLAMHFMGGGLYNTHCSQCSGRCEYLFSVVFSVIYCPTGPNHNPHNVF